MSDFGQSYNHFLVSTMQKYELWSGIHSVDARSLSRCCCIFPPLSLTAAAPFRVGDPHARAQCGMINSLIGLGGRDRERGERGERRRRGHFPIFPLLSKCKISVSLFLSLSLDCPIVSHANRGTRAIFGAPDTRQGLWGHIIEPSIGSGHDFPATVDRL